MSQAFDYNGFVVAPSVPKKTLRTVKKTIHIDSADRDQVKYYTNGDFVVYLPRRYENIVSIRLMGAEFPPLIQGGSGTQAAARQHSYFRSATNSGGMNIPATSYAGDTAVTDNYFLIDLEGLNKTDECAVNANKSTFSDGFFAKIPAVTSNRGNIGAATNMIIYNDHSYQENIARYSPPIELLDRLHIRTRIHSQQGEQGFIYWTSDGAVAGASNRGGTAEFNLTLEIEYLTNSFDEFSSFESRLTERA
jgi:hypothetical protein